MKKNIIALAGIGEVGKTDSLRQFSKLLIKAYPNCKIKKLENLEYGKIEQVPEDDDFRLVVDIGGTIIGIESRGDPSTGLEERLNELAKKFKCDIILTSCRTRSSTKHAIKYIKDTYGFRIIWTSPYTIEDGDYDENEFTKINKLKGKHLLDLLKQLLP